jgi:hypothetical protein
VGGAGVCQVSLHDCKPIKRWFRIDRRCGVAGMVTKLSMTTAAATKKVVFMGGLRKPTLGGLARGECLR